MTIFIKSSLFVILQLCDGDLLPENRAIYYEKHVHVPFNSVTFKQFYMYGGLYGVIMSKYHLTFSGYE